MKANLYVETKLNDKQGRKFKKQVGEIITCHEDFSERITKQFKMCWQIGLNLTIEQCSKQKHYIFLIQSLPNQVE